MCFYRPQTKTGVGQFMRGGVRWGGGLVQYPFWGMRLGISGPRYLLGWVSSGGRGGGGGGGGGGSYRPQTKTGVGQFMRGGVRWGGGLVQYPFWGMRWVNLVPDIFWDGYLPGVGG